MYRNMAPNVATHPTPLIDYIRAGSRSTVGMDFGIFILFYFSIFDRMSFAPWHIFISFLFYNFIFLAPSCVLLSSAPISQSIPVQYSTVRSHISYAPVQSTAFRSNAPYVSAARCYPFNPAIVNPANTSYSISCSRTHIQPFDVSLSQPVQPSVPVYKVTSFSCFRSPSQHLAGPFYAPFSTYVRSHQLA